MNTANSQLLARIFDAMQACDEIGGPDTVEEYVEIMQAIADRANASIAAATHVESDA